MEGNLEKMGWRGEEGAIVKNLGSNLIDCRFDPGGFHDILKLG